MTDTPNTVTVSTTDLLALLDYAAHGEQEDYEQQDDEGRTNHIWLVIQRLREQITPPPNTWTFCGHWENDRIVVDYVLPGAVQDDRIDTGQYPQGLWAASAAGATMEEAKIAAIVEYEMADESFWFAEGYSHVAYGTAPVPDVDDLAEEDRSNYEAGMEAGRKAVEVTGHPHSWE